LRYQAIENLILSGLRSLCLNLAHNKNEIAGEISTDMTGKYQVRGSITFGIIEKSPLFYIHFKDNFIPYKTAKKD
jgi:hypothetical protein